MPEYAHGVAAERDQLLTDGIDALVLSSFAVVAVLNKAATEHDLSLTQLRLLGILRDRRPTMSQLADFLGLDPSSVTGLVERAVTRDLVRRDISPDDRRTARVSLTRTGRRQATSMVARVHGSLTPLFAGLSDTEVRRMTTLLMRLDLDASR